MSANNAVTKRSDTVAALVESMAPQIAKALPTHLRSDRMARVCLTMLRTNPKLMDCKKESLAGALMTAAQVGLEPGVNGQCWIIPYGAEATFVAGYQGLVDLAYRSGQIDYLNASEVCENDEFDYAEGTSPYIAHKRALKDRGEIVAAYAAAKVKGADKMVFVILSRDDIDKVRESSRSGKSEGGPWSKWYEQMAKKTAIKRLCKLLPKSSELNQALQEDEASEAREVDVRIADEAPSALAEGRHARKPGRPAKEAQAPGVTDEDLAARAQSRIAEAVAEEKKGEPCESYTWLCGAYDIHAEKVDAVLAKLGVADGFKSVNRTNAPLCNRAKELVSKALNAEGNA